MTINIVEWAVENIEEWPSHDIVKIDSPDLPDLPIGYKWSADNADGNRATYIVGESSFTIVSHKPWIKGKIKQKDIGSNVVKATIPELLDMEADITIQQIMQVVQAVINTCDVEVKL